MISYCDDCGEYLGDTVNGKLFKFGKLVTGEHICPGMSFPKKVGVDELPPIKKPIPNVFERQTKQ